MLNQPSVMRNEEAGQVSYEVRSSKGAFYYTVTLLSGHAITCQCEGNAKFHRQCKHMKIAEQAEREYQEKQKRSPSQEDFHMTAQLNGDRGFSLLK